jgi:hypothetical protein
MEDFNDAAISRIEEEKLYDYFVVLDPTRQLVLRPAPGDQLRLKRYVTVF